MSSIVLVSFVSNHQDSVDLGWGLEHQFNKYVNCRAAAGGDERCEHRSQGCDARLAVLEPYCCEYLDYNMCIMRHIVAQSDDMSLAQLSNYG